MTRLADQIVGRWTGTPRARLSRITIDLRLQDEYLTGVFFIDALAGTLAVRALELPMTAVTFDGHTVSFRMGQSEGPAMVMRIRGENEALFNPVGDSEKQTLSDPDTIRAIAAHQVILFKS